MKDPYVVLGLPQDASAEELTERYQKLRNQYSEERFLPGAEGNAAAEKLNELEIAWEQIRGDLDRKRNESQYGSDLGYIDNLIRSARYQEAQDALDAMASRPAEWHYLQSIVFFKREWLAESKAQLEMAVNMDPYNEKYRTALDRMRMMEGNPQADPSMLGNQPPPVIIQEKRTCGSDCSTCCMAYICTDCLCNLARCC